MGTPNHCVLFVILLLFGPISISAGKEKLILNLFIFHKFLFLVFFIKIEKIDLCFLLNPDGFIRLSWFIFFKESLVFVYIIWESMNFFVSWVLTQSLYVFKLQSKSRLIFFQLNVQTVLVFSLNFP